MKTKYLIAILTSAYLSTICATAETPSATQPTPGSSPTVPVMTEELMERLIKYTRANPETGSVDAKVCKILELGDGTQDMPLKLVKSDAIDGLHYFGVPANADSKDVLITVNHPTSIDVYLTDKTGTLRAAAILKNGLGSLIANETAAENFRTELALFAKEAADLPATGPTPGKN